MCRQKIYITARAKFTTGPVQGPRFRERSKDWSQNLVSKHYTFHMTYMELLYRVDVEKDGVDVEKGTIFQKSQDKGERSLFLHVRDPLQPTNWVNQN